MATAYHYGSLRTMCRFAELLGRTGDRPRFSSLADRTKAAFVARFCREDGAVGGNEATELAVALAFDLVPCPEKTAERLDRRVRESSYAFDFGMIGSRWIPQTLADHGFVDAASHLVTAARRLSYRGQLEQGATTLWEHWDGHSSCKHVIFGDVSAWMFRTLGGFRFDLAHPMS